MTCPGTGIVCAEPGQAACIPELPLPENIDDERYRRELKRALARVQKFAPEFLVLALGLDTARGDPTGSFRLMARDFRENGGLIGDLGLRRSWSGKAATAPGPSA